MLPGGRGLLDAHDANVLLQLADPLLLAAHHLLQGLDFFQRLLQLAPRLLQEERERQEGGGHTSSRV